MIAGLALAALAAITGTAAATHLAAALTNDTED